MKPLPWPKSMDNDSTTNQLCIAYVRGQLHAHFKRNALFLVSDHALNIACIKAELDEAGTEIRNAFIQLYLRTLITR